MSGILEEAHLAQSMPNGVLNGLLPAQEGTYVSRLPPAVAFVPKEDIRSFLHHKRVGNYLLGRTLGEGSFAKVKEGMNVLTGEKVRLSVVKALYRRST
jgi:Neu-associated kinase